MEKQRIILNAIIVFYIIQRISEMAFSKYNEAILKEKYEAHEVNPRETLKMKLFHTTWFICLLVESNIRMSLQENKLAMFIYFILGLCLCVRMHTMEKLKNFWTIKVLSMKYHEVTSSGLYKYIRHPNYLIVVFEFIFIPLLFKAYGTLVIFSLLNLIVLYQRINLEEKTLIAQSNYLKVFYHTKRLIPYVI